MDAAIHWMWHVAKLFFAIAVLASAFWGMVFAVFWAVGRED